MIELSAVILWGTRLVMIEAFIGAVVCFRVHHPFSGLFLGGVLVALMVAERYMRSGRKRMILG